MKAILFTLILAATLSSQSTIAQSLSANYFEVYTKLAHKHGSSTFSFNKDSIMARINSIPDTADTYATFVVSVNNPGVVDSLFYTLTNSLGQSAFSSAVKVSTANSATFRITDKTLYYTVGPFPYLKHFTATIKMKGTDGALTPTKSFTKN